MEHTEIKEDLGRWQRIALVAGIIGAAASGYGFVSARDAFFPSWLMAFLYWFAIAGGSLALMLIHHLVAGRWSFMIQRPLEAAARTLPLLAILFIPIAMGLPTLYEWARPEAAHDEILAGKAIFLNPTGFIARAAVFFVIWSALAYRFGAWSNRLDANPGDGDAHAGQMRLAGPALVVYVLTATVAFIDWGMSLTPHWFSSMYGPLWLAGQGLSTLSFMAIIGHRIGHRKPVVHYMNHQHFHDIGNMMFAFTILYTYMSLGEYIIIWSGNLYEETEWFLERTGEWNWIALVLALFQFAIPFLLLLNKPIKRHSRILCKVALWILAIRYIGIFWLVAPTFRHHVHFQWLDAATWLAIGGFWLAAFFGFLKSRPLLPEGDPRFKEKFAYPEHSH